MHVEFCNSAAWNSERCQLSKIYRTCKAELRKQLDSPQPLEKPITAEFGGVKGGDFLQDSE